MWAIQLNSFSLSGEGLEVVELPEPVPAEGELLLEMMVAPINPADLNIIEGKYGELPSLPAVLGNEGVGRVREVGAGVTDFQPGDLVLPGTIGTWAQYMTTPASQAILLPNDLEVSQASMLAVNPPTALLMLEDYVALQHGDWIVQNAANSAVGRSVIQIARARGWRTLNVVRRPELVEELTALGADVVVTEEVDLRKEAKSLCGGAQPRLGLNAVGGASALNLCNALQDGGTLVTYGAMGRQPLKIPNGLLIFRLLELRGFWLRRWFETSSPERRREVFTTLAGYMQSGVLQLAVHRMYPLAHVHEAIAEAARESRAGKVLLDLDAR